MAPLSRVLSVLALVAAVPSVVAAQEASPPLSAIDWLSQSVESAALPVTPPVTLSPVDEPPVTNNAATPEITVTPLDRPSPDAVGLLRPEVTGLPRSLWQASPETVLIPLVQAARIDTLPAIQELMVTLMLAEADPPAGAGPSGNLFLARVDRLLDMGALEPAQEMLQAADLEQAEVFRRWFDISLLTGTEDAACVMVRDRPVLAPTYPARIFCLARNGDWAAAALTLNTARALDEITAEEEALLARFLDPDLFEDMPPLPPPTRTSPLVFRMREAIGESLPTAGLPRAFAHADLRNTAAWRNQIEAAERLNRYGAVSETVVMTLYGLQRPAASGGVWDRAAAIQSLQAALEAEDAFALAAALPEAWEAARGARIEVAFARVFAEPLLEWLPADPLTREIAYLSPLYESAALAMEPANASEQLHSAIARGDPAGLDPAAYSAMPQARAIIAAFADPAAPVPEPMASQIAAGQLGEALLRAMSAFSQGIDGDVAAITDALAVLRAVGMEDVARRAALQYLIIDRPA